MTEYATFYRPGEVTLLIEPTNPPDGQFVVQQNILLQVHAALQALGIQLHATQFAGHAGPRPPAVLTHCHGVPHIVHTVNLKSWISPERQRELDSWRGVLQRQRMSVVKRVRVLWERLTGNRRRTAVRSEKPTEQQQALVDVLDAVEILNDPRNSAFLRRTPYSVIAATPNWLATPAQAF